MELANVLRDFIKYKDGFDNETVRNFALKNFSEKLIAQKYKDAYEILVKNNA